MESGLLVTLITSTAVVIPATLGKSTDMSLAILNTKSIAIVIATLFATISGIHFTRVRPMYTSDIENRRHRSLLEHRRIGVGKSPMSML